MKAFIESYVRTHGVVTGTDKDHLHFYEADSSYRIVAGFMPANTSEWIKLPTTGTRPKVFKLYGTFSFQLNNSACQLNVYQSKELMTNEVYKNYLFLPFTDLTNGKETYEGGRYLDITTADIMNKKIMLDFNKAYNPYCAYVSGVYNCPVPPKENALKTAVKAGEKLFTKAH